MNLIHIHRTFHLKTAKYTFFSSIHGSFPRTDHILGHKTGLDKFKKVKIISSIFSNHSGLKLEINYKEKKTGEKTQTHRD